ncbi:MAG: hypothetical protein IKP60_09085 [Treponema sp.]|nr:hypothetical protein [Treponema sp.]
MDKNTMSFTKYRNFNIAISLSSMSQKSSLIPLRPLLCFLGADFSKTKSSCEF